MTNKDPNMTEAECDLLEEKADAIGEILEGTPAYIVLHALLRIAADMGVQSKSDISKREFIADCVECLDFWYDVWEKEGQDE